MTDFSKVRRGDKVGGDCEVVESVMRDDGVEVTLRCGAGRRASAPKIDRVNADSEGPVSNGARGERKGKSKDDVDKDAEKARREAERDAERARRDEEKARKAAERPAEDEDESDEDEPAVEPAPEPAPVEGSPLLRRDVR